MIQKPKPGKRMSLARLAHILRIIAMALCITVVIIVFNI